MWHWQYIYCVALVSQVPHQLLPLMALLLAAAADGDHEMLSGGPPRRRSYSMPHKRHRSHESRSMPACLTEFPGDHTSCNGSELLLLRDWPCLPFAQATGTSVLFEWKPRAT